MFQENPISVAVLNPSAEGNTTQIHYYVLNSDVKGEVPHRGYGVLAELYRDHTLIDRCIVEDVTPSRDQILSFIETLSRNCVTPVTLHDVAEDFICD
jgi:hypothetical protein